jgi:hypothetical protein
VFVITEFVITEFHCILLLENLRFTLLFFPTYLFLFLLSLSLLFLCINLCQWFSTFLDLLHTNLLKKFDGTLKCKNDRIFFIAFFEFTAHLKIVQHLCFAAHRFRNTDLSIQYSCLFLYLTSLSVLFFYFHLFYLTHLSVHLPCISIYLNLSILSVFFSTSSLSLSTNFHLSVNINGIVILCSYNPSTTSLFV